MVSSLFLLAADERGSTRIESEQALATKRHKKHKTSGVPFVLFRGCSFLIRLIRVNPWPISLLGFNHRFTQIDADKNYQSSRAYYPC